MTKQTAASATVLTLVTESQENLCDPSEKTLSTATLLRLRGRFHETRLILDQMRQLLKLTTLIQHHRGACMALLGGDSTFSTRQAQLQNEAKLRIQVLELDSEAAWSDISAAEIENLHCAWKTISHNWHDDSVLENFEYHSHLIDTLNKLLRLSGESLGQTLIEGNASDEGSAYGALQLISLVSKQLPELVERLAQLRGLSTHAAVVRQCDALTFNRIEYLQKKFRLEVVQLDQNLMGLSEGFRERLPTLQQFKLTQVKRDYYLEILTNEILHQNEITTSSEVIYGMASSIIDTYVALAMDGLDVIEVEARVQYDNQLCGTPPAS